MSIIDAIVDGYRDSLASVAYSENSTLVSLPATFASGDMLSVLVTLTGDRVDVTDRGQTADVLGDYGVDWTQGRAAASFVAVRNSVGLAPVFGSEDWEITATTDVADVSLAVHAVADAAMRADGLQVLATATRAGSFADRSVRRLMQRVAVVPRAKMPGRHGESRQVTLSYRGNDDADFYLQALGARDRDTRMNSFDHASGLFLSAAPEPSHRIALLQSGNWEGWQIKSLQEICRVVSEDEVDSFVSRTAA